MSENQPQIKAALKDVWAFLCANENKTVKELKAQLTVLCSAGSKASDKAIKDGEGKIIAITDSFTGRIIPVAGKNAVEIGAGNGSTKYATMSKASNAVYSRQLAKWHKGKDARDAALEFNNGLVAQMLAGEIKAADLESKRKPVQTKEEVEAIKTHTPTHDDNGADISAYLKQGWATRDEAVKALSQEFKGVV